MDTKLAIDLIIGAAMLIGLGGSFALARGHSTKPFDALLLAPPAAAAIYASWWLIGYVRGGGEADAYLRLLAFFALFVIAPAACALSTLLLVSVVINCFRHRWFLMATVLTGIIVGLSYPPGAPQAKPDGELDQSTRGGEEWALEWGARSYDDCKAKSTNRAFRMGCEHQVDLSKQQMNRHRAEENQ